MADNFVERVQNLYAQNKNEEAAELLRDTFVEKIKLERLLAESETLLNVAKKQLEIIKEGNDNFVKFSRGELAGATGNFDDSVKIGEGSYGRVYKGLIRGSSTVAIKLLKQEGSKVLDREFQREMEVLSKIRHQNLVLLIGASPEDRAIVYEYMPNGSLYTYLFDGKNKNKLLWQERVRIASEICSALSFLHSQGIAHGDLRPGNVLLDSNLTSKLSDFGLSRKLEHSKDTITPIYVTERPRGSLAYIDPVYLSFGELSTKSDVFAFGIILLQLVTGTGPQGLRSDVEKALYNNKLDKLVDSSARWPFKEALKLAELGIRCSDHSRQKRPVSSEVYDTIESIKSGASTSSGHSRWFKKNISGSV